MPARPTLLILALATLVCAADFPYQQPPKEIRDVLNALPTPAVSVSPQRDYAIFLQALRYPPIAQVAQPFLPLAGLRVDANSNGLHMANYFISFAIKRLPGGEDIAIALPSDGKFGLPVWSPDGKQFAFTNTVAKGVELWIGAPSTGQVRRISGIRVNGVQIGGPPIQVPIQWMGDNRTLIVSTVPAGRGPVPSNPSSQSARTFGRALETPAPRQLSRISWPRPTMKICSITTPRRNWFISMRPLENRRRWASPRSTAWFASRPIRPIY